MRPAVDLESTSENVFSSAWAEATKPNAVLAWALAEAASVRRWALDRRTGARAAGPEPLAVEVDGASYHSAMRSILSALLKWA